jgi:tRNA(Ile)-lysidine synthase
MPSQAIVQRILDEVVAAREDANPVVLTQGYSVRRYRNALYCLKPSLNSLGNELIWVSGESSLRIADDVIYQVETSSSGIPVEQWHNARITLRFRLGGETIELPGRKGHHDLKKLYQEAGIPPWERTAIPLIYLDDKLAAVGEHWISAEFYSVGKEPCFHIVRHKINPKGNDDAPDVD